MECLRIDSTDLDVQCCKIGFNPAIPWQGGYQCHCPRVAEREWGTLFQPSCCHPLWYDSACARLTSRGRSLIDSSLARADISDQRAHLCKNLRFEQMRQLKSRKINGLDSYDHRTVRGLLSDFFHCILLKKLDFKSKPYISVRMHPLARFGRFRLLREWHEVNR
jgi:hypothetical protein